MWGKGKKRKDEGEFNSDGSPPSKKTAKKNSGDIFVCELSTNRRVSLRSWKGNIMVDIREFYSKDGKQLPGKKGISLPMDQWKILRDHIDKIDKAVTESA